MQGFEFLFRRMLRDTWNWSQGMVHRIQWFRAAGFRVEGCEFTARL